MQLGNIVQDFFYNLNTGDPEKVRPFLAANFRCETGAATLNRDEFLETYTGLLRAFRPRSFNVFNENVTGNVVSVTVNFIGTHSEPLALPIMAGSVQPTNKQIETSDAPWVFMFAGEQIELLEISNPLGASVSDIVRAVGGVVSSPV
jgi:hypothetical protein